MNYTLKAGALYARDGTAPLALLRGGVDGPEKQVLSPDGALLLRTAIRGPSEKDGKAQSREYVMLLEDGAEYAAARPLYVASDRRTPRVDRAALAWEGRDHLLAMESPRTYLLADGGGRGAVRITHRGLPGGWTVEAPELFPPAFLCGLFAFCRYMERENEFLVE